MRLRPSVLLALSLGVAGCGRPAAEAEERGAGPVTIEVREARERRMLNVSATAERYVDPDRCRVFLGCQSQEESLAAARERNNARMNRVLDALAGLKIPWMKVKAPSLSVSIIYSDEPRRVALGKVLGYRVTQQFTALLEKDDPKALSEAAGKVIDAAMAAGANILGQVVFFKQDERAIQRELLGEAVRNALADARAIAVAAGSTLSGVWNLSSTPSNRYEDYMQNAQMQQVAGPAGSSEGTSVIYGQVKVSCSVSMSAEMK